MSKLSEAEYKLRRFDEMVKKELDSSRSNAKKYGGQFVRTNKQEDRHSAMSLQLYLRRCKNLGMHYEALVESILYD